MARSFRLIVALLLMVSLPTLTLAQRRGAKAKRVAPPKFDSGETKTYFFPDVFSVLVGDRPNLSAVPVDPKAATPGATSGGNTTVSGWAAVIDGETIENEIKSIKTKLETTITSPGAFRGGGFKVCRRDFTMAAMLFGIINEYDDDVRFKDNASGLRDVLARTGHNCKVGTTQVYNEAKLRREDLQDVIGGAKYQGKKGDPDATWDKICDRSPLMQRLEFGFDEKIQPATSSEAEFKKNKDLLLHESQLMGAIAMVLMKNGMEDGDDEDYQAFCNDMKKGAADIVAGAKQDNYEMARAGAGIITKSCATCHENYRG